MSEAYSDVVLDHFKNPRNVGTLTSGIVGHAENPASGASLDLYLSIGENRMIDRACFKAHGCAATIAAGSLATELLIGRVMDASPILSKDELAEALGGLPPARKHAYRLVTDAIQSAAQHYSVSIAESA